MKGHLKQKTIIQRALAGHEAIAADSHMQTCPRCRKHAEEFRLILSPSEESTAAPSPGVEARIQATRRQLEKSTAAGSIKGVKLQMPGRLILAGSAAVLSVLLAITIMLIKTEKPVPRHIAITPGTEEITVNDVKIGSVLVLPENNDIATIKGAATIGQKDSFSILLSRNSDLSIQGLTSDQSQLPLFITLKKGTLTADILKGENKFIFQTAQAKIIITGTRFRLSAADATTVSLHEGSVMITALSSGKTRSLAAGSTCVITDAGTFAVAARHAASVKAQKMVKEEKAGSITGEETKKDQKNSSEIRQERTQQRKEIKEDQRQMREIKRSLRQRKNR